MSCRTRTIIHSCSLKSLNETEKQRVVLEIEFLSMIEFFKRTRIQGLIVRYNHMQVQGPYDYCQMHIVTV